MWWKETNRHSRVRMITLSSWTALRTTINAGASGARARKSAMGMLAGARSLVCKHNSWGWKNLYYDLIGLFQDTDKCKKCSILLLYSVYSILVTSLGNKVLLFQMSTTVEILTFSSYLLPHVNMYKKDRIHGCIPNVWTKQGHCIWPRCVTNCTCKGVLSISGVWWGWREW